MVKFCLHSLILQVCCELEQGANQPGMGDLLDPALDDLRVVNKAMKDVEKLLSEPEKE